MLTKTFAASFTPAVPAVPYQPYSKVCPPPPPVHTFPGAAGSGGATGLQPECFQQTFRTADGSTVMLTICIGDEGSYIVPGEGGNR